MLFLKFKNFILIYINQVERDSKQEQYSKLNATLLVLLTAVHLYYFLVNTAINIFFSGNRLIKNVEMPLESKLLKSNDVKE